jgi:PAS domain-containing protein
LIDPFPVDNKKIPCKERMYILQYAIACVYYNAICINLQETAGMKELDGREKTILDSINEGVFTVDLNWRITSFNLAAERITQVKRREGGANSDPDFNGPPERRIGKTDRWRGNIPGPESHRAASERTEIPVYV